MKIKNKRVLAKWQQLLVFALILVLPVSALMFAVLQTDSKSSHALPSSQGEYYWRDDRNDNTRIGIGELEERFGELSRSGTTQESYEREIWETLVELQRRYDRDMWREINSESVVDFVNYQTEELYSIDEQYKQDIRQGVGRESAEMVEFLDGYIFGETQEFGVDVAEQSNSRLALIAIPGLGSGAYTTMNVALNTTNVIVKGAGWLVPAFITAGIVLAALVVITVVIILNWDVIRASFNNLVNQFLSVAGKVADAVRGFFDGIRGQVNSALSVVINGVKYVIEIALTTATVAQMQKNGYYFLVLRNGDNKMFFNPSSVSQSTAINALRLNKGDVGTYTLAEFDAKNIAKQASSDGGLASDIPEQHSNNGRGLYFLHYHPNKARNAHSWFGAPIWS